MRGNLLDWTAAEALRDRHQRGKAAKTNVYKQAGVFFGVW
jgi:hypothetical protein